MDHGQVKMMKVVLLVSSVASLLLLTVAAFDETSAASGVKPSSDTRLCWSAALPMT